MKIPFAPPYIDDDVKNEVLSVLTSGWITSGPKVLELEKLVAAQSGVDHVVCCNSATSALMLMLHWYGVGKGDEVIIPAYTYAATALAVMHVGATPVMVDAAADFNIDTARIREKITAKTKVIIPVDIAGWPCDYQALLALVNDPEVRGKFVVTHPHQAGLSRILLLSDAAHSIGAVYKGMPSAQWADFTVFSFHAVKNVTTAEGGAICINLPSGSYDNAVIYRQLKLWALNGQTKDALAKSQGASWKYDIVYPGYKMNMPDICAAIGLAQLKKYPTVILPARRRVFDAYRRILEGFPWTTLPPEHEDRTSSCHVFALRIRDISEQQRDAIIDRIAASGVSVNVHFQPLPLLTVFRNNGFDIADYPVAYDNYAREISLPVYPELDEKMIRFVTDAVVNAYQSVITRHG